MLLSNIVDVCVYGSWMDKTFSQSNDLYPIRLSSHALIKEILEH